MTDSSPPQQPSPIPGSTLVGSPHPPPGNGPHRVLLVAIIASAVIAITGGFLTEDWASAAVILVTAVVPLLIALTTRH